MALADELNNMHQQISSKIPEMSAKFDEDTAQAVAEGVGTHGPQAGDTAPTFTLPDQVGRQVNSSDLLQQGPLVISFYRGNWCPYCNLELRALQASLPEFQAHGASLVAISPQVPDQSMSTAEKNDLTFSVLSDEGGAVAKRFGLVFTMSESLRTMYQTAGIDLPAFNGNESFELPVPGTFVVGSDGIIRLAFANADYKQRLEPSAILEALAQISTP